jgi:hypothetical protein
MGVNGIDLELAKAGEYEMRLVADAGGDVRCGDRTRVVVR